MRKLITLAVAFAAACGTCSAIAALPSSSSTAPAQCATAAAPLAAFDAVPAEPGLATSGYTVSSTKAAAQRAREMQDLHAWLSLDAVEPKQPELKVALSREERHRIGDGDCPECEDLVSDERRYLVGVAKPVGLNVNFSSLAGRSFVGAYASGRLSPTADGGFAWTTTIHSPGAHALRVVFDRMNLGDQAELYVFNTAGEAFGPYERQGMNDSGTLVSNAITGDTVNVQLRYYGTPSASDLARTRFSIAEVGHIGSRFGLAKRVNAKLADATKAFCSYNAACVVNGECATGWSALGATRQGVAHMLFQSGSGFYICSGGLLANTSGSPRPLFLTANHCISTNNEANSLETFWDYRAPNCESTLGCDFSYAQMRIDFPTVLGATMLAHGSSGDYSLMDLAAVPEGTRTFLGFNTTAIATSGGFDLFRLSHPKGSPQAFSRQDVNSTAGTCTTLPRGAFIYSTDSLGATEGGSSGSPVLNTAGQVVGQLYGACGTNLNDVCDSAKNRTVDGALAHYYASVDEFLDPQGGGGGAVAHVGSIVLSRTTLNGNRTRGVASVTVLDANNQPLAGASVSGAFSGHYTGSGSATTDASGVATFTSGAKKGSGAFTFCVNGITGTNLSYNPGANSETCDTL